MKRIGEWRTWGAPSLLVSALLWLTPQPAVAQLIPSLTLPTPNLISPTSGLVFSGGVVDAWGPLFKPQQPCAAPSIPPGLADSVRRWNAIAISANALDHTPVAPGESRVFGEQLGPGRTSRALAIVHIAIFDAVNAIA